MEPTLDTEQTDSVAERQKFLQNLRTIASRFLVPVPFGVFRRTYEDESGTCLKEESMRFGYYSVANLFAAIPEIRLDDDFMFSWIGGQPEGACLEEVKEKVVEVLRRLKNNASIKEINDSFMEKYGEAIPFANFGYNGLRTFLEEHPMLEAIPGGGLFKLREKLVGGEKNAKERSDGQMSADGASRADDVTGEEKSDEDDMDEEDEGDDEEDSHDDEDESSDDKESDTVGRLLFVCPIKNCPANYNTFNELEEHMKIHPDKQDFFCDICQKNFSSKDDAMAHIQVREKKECCGCGKKLSTNSRLIEHLRSHTGEKPFVCKTCEKGFALLGNLKNHMLTHTGEKKFSCGFCKKGFAKKSDLKRHERVHTGEKPYECNLCDFKCTYPFTLSVHKRKHTGEKPYSCGHCEKRFSLKGNLKAHERTHTGEKPFKCPRCDYRCNQNGALTAHIRIHTGQKPFSCKKCDKKFTRSDSLKEHMKRIHPS